MLGSYLKRSCYNTFVYSFTSIFSRVVNFFFLPFLLSRLTLAEFGIWDFYQSFFSLSALLLSSCATTSLTRFSFNCHDDEDKAKQVVGNSFLLVFVSVIIFGFFYTLLANYSTLIGVHPFLHITTINICLFVLFSHMISYVRVKEFLTVYTLLFLAQNVVATLLTVGGVYYNWGVQAFFYGTALSLLIFLPGFFYLFWNYRYFSYSLLKEQLYFSAPLLIYGLLYSGFFTIDRFLV